MRKSLGRLGIGGSGIPAKVKNLWKGVAGGRYLWYHSPSAQLGAGEMRSPKMTTTNKNPDGTTRPDESRLREILLANVANALRAIAKRGPAAGCEAEVEEFSSSTLLTVRSPDGERVGTLSVYLSRDVLEMRVSIMGDTFKTTDDLATFAAGLEFLRSCATMAEVAITPVDDDDLDSSATSSQRRARRAGRG